MNRKLTLQYKYESIVKELNKHSDSLVVLTVRYYGFKPFARLISLGAILKGREKWSHTAYLYKYGHDPRIVEASVKFKGMMHHGLHDKYFNGKFHGKVVAHIIPAYISDSERFDICDFIEHGLYDKKYGLRKAFKAFFYKNQRDLENIVYCTDIVLDLIEKRLGREIVGNNATITPSQLKYLLDKEGYQSIELIDTRNV